jgi:hypothetical protein
MRARVVLVLRPLAVGLIVLALGVSNAGGAGWPRRPPARVLDAIRLRPLPARVVDVCRRQQRRVGFTVFCPRRLPRATFEAHGSPPSLRADAYGAIARSGRRIDPYGVAFGYSAPVEPTSGPGWRRHLWLNRPCCFLHFTVYRRPDGRPIPRAARPATVAGRRGLLKDASGYGFSDVAGIYWGNHIWFFWRQDGVPYAASLHFFGRPGTHRLFVRLLRELVPADRLAR